MTPDTLELTRPDHDRSGDAWVAEKGPADTVARQNGSNNGSAEIPPAVEMKTGDTHDRWLQDLRYYTKKALGSEEMEDLEDVLVVAHNLYSRDHEQTEAQDTIPTPLFERAAYMIKIYRDSGINLSLMTYDGRNGRPDAQPQTVEAAAGPDAEPPELLDLLPDEARWCASSLAGEPVEPHIVTRESDGQRFEAVGALADPRGRIYLQINTERGVGAIPPDQLRRTAKVSVDSPPVPDEASESSSYETRHESQQSRLLQSRAVQKIIHSFYAAAEYSNRFIDAVTERSYKLKHAAAVHLDRLTYPAANFMDRRRYRRQYRRKPGRLGF